MILNPVTSFEPKIMKFYLSVILSVLSIFPTFSQENKAGLSYTSKISNNPLAQNNNADKIGKPRTQQYFPENGGFVCENGSNRYTRALYGGFTQYRVETSDRPVFALVKNGSHRNLQFSANEITLDSTDYCKAIYKDGIRSYLLKDKRWGKDAVLNVKVIALPDREGAVWWFETSGLPDGMVFKAEMCEIANPKLQRNGDIGADKPGVLEASPDKKSLETFTWKIPDHEGESFFVLDNAIEYTDCSNDEANTLFNTALKYYQDFTGNFTFTTPDPYINTLAQALMLAADGAWDGETWQHGAIGWRIPLAGWRAAYMGDVLGMKQRQRSHFNAYALSQVTDVEPIFPHPSQDSAMNLARAEKKWGTQMYSNGYICRNPNKNNVMHHYDMNLNYVDELLWHFQHDADTTYMRQMWPLLKSHLEWEKRNFDPDGDHLYDAYCCIWASDALYYNGGAVTHSSAYNYRGNRLAARIAEIIGEDPEPYNKEADAILNAINNTLWMPSKGVWAEFKDAMGLKRLHENPALWTIYTAIDCGVSSPEQAWLATGWINQCIPHINVENTGFKTISTSNWTPYAWSINNVAPAEVMHTVLAFFEAGRNEDAFNLMKANLMDNMYYGVSPGNFGQISYYDAARGECYRDFSDCTGISSRTLVQGLFGIVPQALYGKCIIRPGFPDEWESATISTPYLSYSFQREGDEDVYTIEQNFSQPLEIVFQRNLGGGRWEEVKGTAEKKQVIRVPRKIKEKVDEFLVERIQISPELLGLSEPDFTKPFTPVAINSLYNAEVDDIFKNEYLSPRPATTTLQIPVQGIGEWCHPKQTAEINDSVFRELISDDTFMVAGVPFNTPKEGDNIIYTTLWDNYPDQISIPLEGKASSLYLLLAGSTNHMQSRMDNGVITVTYTDGSYCRLPLINPDNWCPIEQDFYIDNKAFYTTEPRPYRVALATGTVSRDLGNELNIDGVYGREIPGGAAQMLRMIIDDSKQLEKLTITPLSNDVVIGLMGITLQ